MAAAALLTIMHEGQVIKTQPIEGEVVLGRAEGCAIRLDDRAISRQHAIFRRVGNSVQVENKSEFAPLTVNGAECNSAVLKEGDVVSIGPYLVRLSIPTDAVPQTAQSVTSQEEGLGDKQLLGLDSPSLDSPAMEAGGAISLDENGSPELSVDSEIDSHAAVGGLGAGADNGSNNEIAQHGGSLGLGITADDAIHAAQEIEAQEVLPEVSQEVPQELSVLIDEDGKTKITPAGKVAVKLIFKPGTANVTTYELTQDEVSIGRGKNCDIVLNDKKASRKNSIIRRVGLNFSIKDLESANGTFVNGVRVQDHELSGEDTIKIGSVEFQFKAMSSDYAAKEKDFMSIPSEQSPELDGQLPGQLIGEPVGDAFALPTDPAVGITPEVAGQPGVVGGMGGIPGITGIGENTGKKKTLMERFKALPKRTQYIGIVAAILFLAWLNEDDPQVGPKVLNRKKPATSASPAAGPISFESLSSEKKSFIEAQHGMAFDYYRNKEYDKALFEIEKIFTIIPDYKDAREIERYAREGKRKMEAIEDERRKKEEETKLKAKIAQLVEDTRTKMEKKQYDQARDAFSDILALDPDNTSVIAWKKEIDGIEEQKRMIEQQKQVQSDINKHAWDIYNEAMAQKKSKRFHEAIHSFQKAIDVGASDPGLLPRCKKMILVCHSTINHLRDPILKEAKEQEDAGEFSKAFVLYKKATHIDPPHPAGHAGMSRIKGVLHDRAKAIYTEAVLAESYSDFNAAKKMYQDCLQVAPSDDVYYERAQRKLAHYFTGEERGGPSSMSQPRDSLRARVVSTFTGKGRRPIQEDYVLVDREKGIFVVADGFGGPNSGTQASKVACEAVKSFLFKEAGDLEATLPFVLRNYFSLPGNVLFNSLIFANRKLNILNRGKNVHERGGASVIAGFIDGDLLAIANVGLCTAWLFRGGKCTELVVPRSYGRLCNPFEMNPLPEWRVPLISLGMSEDLEPEIVEYKVKTGDWVVFATDGIAPEAYQKILEVKGRNGDAEKSAQDISKFLDQCSFEDNASLSLVIF